MSKVKNEDCRRKPYISLKNLKDMRDIYAQRLYMLPLGGNYKHDNRFASSNWSCLACGEEGGERVSETQEHVATQCPGYYELRQEHDLETDVGLVNFYRAVMTARLEREEEKKTDL